MNKFFIANSLVLSLLFFESGNYASLVIDYRDNFRRNYFMPDALFKNFEKMQKRGIKSLRISTSNELLSEYRFQDSKDSSATTFYFAKDGNIDSAVSEVYKCAKVINDYYTRKRFYYYDEIGFMNKEVVIRSTDPKPIVNLYTNYYDKKNNIITIKKAPIWFSVFDEYDSLKVDPLSNMKFFLNDSMQIIEFQNNYPVFYGSEKHYTSKMKYDNNHLKQIILHTPNWCLDSTNYNQIDFFYRKGNVTSSNYFYSYIDSGIKVTYKSTKEYFYNKDGLLNKISTKNSQDYIVNNTNYEYDKHKNLISINFESNEKSSRDGGTESGKEIFVDGKYKMWKGTQTNYTYVDGLIYDSCEYNNDEDNEPNRTMYHYIFY